MKEFLKRFKVTGIATPEPAKNVTSNGKAGNACDGCGDGCGGGNGNDDGDGC